MAKASRYPIDPFVGLRIATVRLGKNLTQKQLSKRANLSHTTVCLLEKGKQRISVEMLIGIARAMEVPVGELIPDSGPMPVYDMGKHFKKVAAFKRAFKEYQEERAELDRALLEKWKAVG